MYEQIATVKSKELALSERLKQLEAESSKVELSFEDLAEVVEIWTGIPSSSITENEYERIDRLEERLKSRIIGQDEAVSAVARAIKRSKKGSPIKITNPPNPASSKAKLFISKTYVDLELKDSYPSYIINVEAEGKYNIYLPSRESNFFAPKNMLRFYGENDHFENNKLRTVVINPDLINIEITDIIQLINRKLKKLGIILPDEAINLEKEPKDANKFSFSLNGNANKDVINDENGNSFDITGYFTYQFLEGILNDCLSIIKNSLKSNNSLNFC